MSDNITYEPFVGDDDLQIGMIFWRKTGEMLFNEALGIEVPERELCICRGIVNDPAEKELLYYIQGPKSMEAGKVRTMRSGRS